MNSTSWASQELEFCWIFFPHVKHFQHFSDMVQITLLAGKLMKVCLITLLLYKSIQQYDLCVIFVVVVVSFPSH